MDAPITASTHTHVGTPPLGYDQGWVKHTVHVHGFPSLSTVRGENVNSPEFMLLGNQWCVRIYPGGDANADEGTTSLSLYNKSNKAIDIDFGFCVYDGDVEQVVYERTTTPRNFGPVGNVATSGRGFTNFALRSELLSSLVDGTLIIKVHMKLATPMKSLPPPYIPENLFAKNIQRMIIDENFGDISFVVGGQQQMKNNAERVIKTAPVVFHAHRYILRECSTVYSQICVDQMTCHHPQSKSQMYHRKFFGIFYTLLMVLRSVVRI
jgi:hypothetical protein